MNNIDNFKLFVRKNPSLYTYIKNGKMTWQKFYELYDLYGEDNKVWEEYLSTNTESKKSSISSILDMAKNMDTDKIEESINSIQKVIGLFGDMISKDNNTSEYTPRPIYKKFDD